MSVRVVNTETGQTVTVAISADSPKPTTHAIQAAFRQGFSVRGALVRFYDVATGEEILGNF